MGKPTTGADTQDATKAAGETLAQMLSRANSHIERLIERNRALSEQLEAAANIRISHTDSDSRVASLNEERVSIIRRVVMELRKPV